jgi:trimeric autotransporter adhesin
VFYRISNVPPAAMYQGPVFETFSYNNNAFVPSSFYAANNPRLYDDPDAPPYDINHQFVFDITDSFEANGNKVGVDPTIHGHTTQYNDFVIAFPGALPSPAYTLTFVAPLGSGSPSFAEGTAIPVAFTLFQVTAPISNAVTPPNAVSVGLANAAGVRLPALAPNGTAAAFTFNATLGQYTLTLNTLALQPGTYTLFVNSNLFVQQSTTFTITAAPLQILTATALPAGTVSTPYSQFFTATGGTTPYTWSVVSPALPPGLNLSSTGRLSGTPTTAGSFGLTVQVTDAAQHSSVQQFTLTVAPAPPSLVSIAVTPANPSIGLGGTQPFTATGTFSNNTMQNLTSSVAWSSAPTTAATISAGGVATAAAVGSSTITASVGSVSASTVLQVTAVAMLEPLIGFNPVSLTFANQLISTSSAAQTITVSNTGSAPLTISSIALTGTNPAEFAETNTCPLAPATLAVDTSCAVGVSFAPLAVGTRTANVTFTDNTGGITGSQQNIPLSGTASAPAPITTSVQLSYPVGTNVSEVATINCPSGTVPCTDPNAHSLKLVVSQVLTPFTLTVTAFEVSLSQANGVCPAGQTETTDFDCRFKDNFTLQTEPNGDVIVPQCIPFSNGNCVFYRVSNVPPQASYVGPVFENFSWNNNAYVPSSFYAANNPRLYDDPDAPPFDVNHQFVFDITDFFEAHGNKVGVDPTIHGHTTQYNDFVVAFTAALPNPAYTLTFVPPLGSGSPSFVQGVTIPVGFTLVQGTTPITNAVTAPNAVSVGLANAAGVRFAALAPNGTAAAFTYNATAQQYVLSLATQALAPGTYTLFVNSNLFVQQSTSFTVTAATLVSIAVTPANSSIVQGTTQQFTATGTFSNGSTQVLSGVTWSSSQSMEASISATGLASALAVGSPMITATLAGTSGTVTGSTTLTVTTNTPQISAKVLDTGTQSGALFVDVQYTNSGVGIAEKLTLTTLTFRTLTGSGTVTYNTQLSPPIPDLIGGSVSAGNSVTVRYFLNVPSTVTRFSISEVGTFSTTSGQALTFAAAQAVFNN